MFRIADQRSSSVRGGRPELRDCRAQRRARFLQRIWEFNLEHAQDVVRRSEETAGFRLCIANSDRELPALVNDAVNHCHRIIRKSDRVRPYRAVSLKTVGLESEGHPCLYRGTSIGCCPNLNTLSRVESEASVVGTKAVPAWRGKKKRCRTVLNSQSCSGLPPYSDADQR